MGETAYHTDAIRPTRNLHYGRRNKVKIEKKILIDNMPGLYAVGQTTLDGEPYYIASSEAPDGPVAVIHAETKEIHPIHGGKGGVMGIIPSVRKNTLLSIEEFYLGFNAPGSKIIEIGLEKNNGKWEAASRKVVAEVPYLHRITLLKEADGYFVAAGKLCRKKDFTDDWSSAGLLEMIAYDGENVLGREELKEPIFKHHAMLTEKDGSGDIVYYGGTEGVFRTVRKDGSWETERLLDVPASEIVFTDLDGDGKRELAIVEEFHGDKAVVFKDREGCFERAWEYPMKLGHVLYGGNIAGRCALVSGSREGRRDLSIHYFKNENGEICLSETVTVAEGGGPSQIAVRDLGDRAEILTANYAKGELALYTVSEE